MKNDSFTYHAFISYSHKDKDFAQKLQRRLEQYLLSPVLLNSGHEMPHNVSPVFIDESSLIIRGTLKESLQHNLDMSKYLIVICSANSAKSEYVNYEVEYFISKGRTGNIIPLIADGEPNAKDSSLECFPPALLKLLRKKELPGINLKKLGQHDAFMKIIAILLGLNPDEFV